MMFSKFRSLIFKFDPETAHTLAIKSLKLNLAPNIFNENQGDSMFESVLFGKKIDNPIGIAAGFDKNAEVYNPLFKLGFGFVEVGTITPLKQYGNPKPRVFRLVEDQALINRLGFNNLGSDNVNTRIRLNLPKGLLGINIGPNKETKDRLNDYLIGIKTFHDIADYITVNISSPNTDNLRNFHDEKKFEELIKFIEKEKIKLKTKIPIVVKISPDIMNDQINKISEVLLKYKISAIIVSNTTENRQENLKNILKYQKGGLSGKPLEQKSNELISKFYNLLKNKIKIIGVGGVDSGKSAYEKFLSGASYVQLYTGMVFQGPNVVGKIKKELKELLINDGVKNFKEIVGKKHN
jgi:dihydroorotate dehydrogenase